MKYRLLLNCSSISSRHGTLLCVGTSHYCFHKFKASKHINHGYSRNNGGPYHDQNIMPMGSSLAIPLGGLVSSQLGLIPSVKQISNALGEPRMETKLVPGHLRTPWPPHPLPPKGVHFMRGTCNEQHEWASRSPGQASRPPSVRPRVSIQKTSKGPSHVGEWDKG